MEVNLDDIVTHLRKVKGEHGEEAYRQALDSFARNIASTKEGLEFVQKIGAELQDEGLDLERLQEEAKAQQQLREQAAQQARESIPKGEGFDADDVFIKALQQQMPDVKTQAHFDIVQAAFQALQLCLNSYFAGDSATAEKARGGLNQTLDLAGKVRGIDEKIADNPEAVSNEDFVKPPREFTMDDTVKQILRDLDGMESVEKLNQWYVTKKDTLDNITDQKVRNRVFDKIRKTKKDLLN